MAYNGAYGTGMNPTGENRENYPTPKEHEAAWAAYYANQQAPTQGYAPQPYAASNQPYAESTQPMSNYNGYDGGQQQQPPSDRWVPPRGYNAGGYVQEGGYRGEYADRRGYAARGGYDGGRGDGARYDGYSDRGYDSGRGRDGYNRGGFDRRGGSRWEEQGRGGYRGGPGGGPGGRGGYQDRRSDVGFSRSSERVELKETIFVQGIPVSANETYIADVFGAAGEIGKKDSGQARIKIYTDRATGENKGECMVTFVDAASAQKAIEQFNGQSFPGGERPMTVSIAKMRPLDSSRGRGGYRGGYQAPRGGGATGNGGNREPRPNDWHCEACGNDNFAFRQQCNKCQAPRSGEVADGGPMRASGGVNSGDRHRPY